MTSDRHSSYGQWFLKHSPALVFSALGLVLLLALITALVFPTPLLGLPSSSVWRMNAGWQYIEGGTVYDAPQLPCRLQASGNVLELVHALPEATPESREVLAFPTRYATIRVWADETLVYEAAVGEEHALGSMWHFIPLSDCAGAEMLRVELTRYETADTWELGGVLLDHPDAIRMSLYGQSLPAIGFWLVCMLLALLLLFLGALMAMQRMAGATAMLALAAFIFLSGTWILLDSKVTTIEGGNYALSYFFSYAAFYLMLAPYLLFIQLMLESRSWVLQVLKWAVVANAAVCMVLHLSGAVPIRHTAFVVHILVVLSLLALSRIFWDSVIKRRERKLLCTACGTLLLYGVGLVSIVLFYLQRLSANSLLYAWGLLILILGAALDAVLTLTRFWKQRQTMEQYRALATRDSMTGLKNRNAYELRIQKLAENPPEQLSFILFDMDNLKEINDTYGHHVGDLVIFLAAQCLLDVFEPYGECFRIGGDEFCVICAEDVELPRLLARYEVLIARNQPEEVSFSVSHGWACQVFDGGKKISQEEIAAIQNAADENLYQAKKQRKQ